MFQTCHHLVFSEIIGNIPTTSADAIRIAEMLESNDFDQILDDMLYKFNGEQMKQIQLLVQDRISLTEALQVAHRLNLNLTRAIDENDCETPNELKKRIESLNRTVLELREEKARLQEKVEKAIDVEKSQAADGMQLKIDSLNRTVLTLRKEKSFLESVVKTFALNVEQEHNYFFNRVL